MKFIALISGGKDSTFAIHECQRQGHELVALANLYPLEGEGEAQEDGPDAAGDLDSWCFQTVGHGLVAAYARCGPRGVPLFRRATRGAARRRGLSYPPSRATPGDEVEDLAALLAFVAARIRAAEEGEGGRQQRRQRPPPPAPLGVCSGAVASDYQRLRVEAVACGRLGLVSLAPLWRRAQYPLLRAMDRAGVRAIVAKVAAAGLCPRRDLGRDVACLPMRRRLAALRAQYGLNVCGEGGEYETLTLDAPRGVFPRGRVVLGGEGGGVEGGGDDDNDETRRRGWRMVVTSEDAVAPGGALVPVSFRVVPRDDEGGGEPQGEVVEVPRGYVASPPPPPPLTQEKAAAAAKAGAECDGGDTGGLRARVSVRASERHAVVGCRVVLPAARPRQGEAASETTARAVRVGLRAVERAAAALLLERSGAARHGGGGGAAAASPPSVWPRTLFVHLLLRDMGHFAAANAAYCSVVPLLRPPARACVEAPLPAGCLLHVDALVLLPPPPPSAAVDGLPGPDGGRRAEAARMTRSGGDDGDDDDRRDAINENDGDGDDDDDGAGGEAGQARLGRRVLHVQSVSPWAPACIGPYGQAAADGLGGLLHLAGQIPLDPASMELLGPAAAVTAAATADEDEEEERAASQKGCCGDENGASPATVLKHTDRVLRSCQAVAVAAGGRMDGQGCAGAAVYLSPEGAARGAGAAAAAVAAFLREGRTAEAEEAEADVEEEEEEEEDGASGQEEEEEDDGYVDEYLRPLELPRGRVRVDQTSWLVGGGGGPGRDEGEEEGAAPAAAACIYAVVPRLPRGALVEVQPTLLDLRAFAPGGSAGEPPSSSSSEEEEAEEEEGDDGARAEAAAAKLPATTCPPPSLPADVAALAASTGARAHLRAYSWLSQAPGRRRRQPQRRLVAHLLVALPLEGQGGDGGFARRAAAAAVASALAEARPALACAGRPSSNVASVRAWCTPEAYAGLTRGGDDDDDDDDGGAKGGDEGEGAPPLLFEGGAAQLLPALEVRCSADGEGGLSPPCSVVVELVILH